VTNEEIQCLILKIGYNDPEGFVHLPRVNTKYGVPYKKVLYNAQWLKDKCLVKAKLMGGSTPGELVGDVEITEAGRREYKSRCAR